MDLTTLTTETRNTKTMALDQMSIAEILKTMNEEDQKIPLAVKKVLPVIEQAVKKSIASFNAGGRLIYFGAGTSGRLGVLDAAECVPTFGVSKDLVVGLIAGGERAMTLAVEGAEDSLTLAKEDLTRLNLTDKDTVVGIAASGRTPYVIGGLTYAKEVGATRISLACNTQAEISNYSELAIEVAVGPEILTGSTRLKAGTAQKLVLNMISTCSMVGIGKVFQNLMVDVLPTNDKLEERALNIIVSATECSKAAAQQAFLASDKRVKVAIVMLLTGTTAKEAEEKLVAGKGFIRNTLDHQ